MTCPSYSILLIDDDDVDRMSIRRALKKADVRGNVDEAVTGQDGWSKLSQTQYDCVFLDYMLPDHNGLGLLQQLRDAGIDTPVIVLTGQGSEQIAVEIMKAGASDYLTKDAVTPEGIARSIQQVTKIHRAELERRRAEEELRATNLKLREAQNQLLQSEKMASIGQLAAGVAHEINNPMGYISSNFSSLKTYVQDICQAIELYQSVASNLAACPQWNNISAKLEKLDIEFLREDALSLLEESGEGIHRVKQIVQDLKDFSHVGESDWQWSNLHDGLNSTLNIVRNEVKYKAEVVKDYGDLPDIECLPSQLNQVFMNLLINAAHAIPQQGTITVRTGSNDDEWVWVEIADTGCGIPAETLNKIFDPFFTTKPVGAGTGLGLSLSYSIVERHHGRIEVQSDPGQGTCFRICLPIRQTAPASTAELTP